MLKENNLTEKLIYSMSYVDFISLLRETNRCPGGKNTIRKIIQNTFIQKGSKVLEIGSNTGFTSLEFARTTQCEIIGIDPIQAAVDESNRELSQDHPDIQARVKFQVGSAYQLDFQNNHFDLVVTGGATSFMDNKNKALTEYHRVIKPWGFLSVTNLCYLTPPPKNVIDDVSNTIGVNINPWSDKEWLHLFEKSNLFEIYYNDVIPLESKSQKIIQEYIEHFMEKDHILELDQSVQNAIKNRWHRILEVFNENHKYLGFIFAIFRKRYLPEEPELFTIKRN
jgi:ubiquinone/menaquinone biosynthesis C-methylase UbiE